MAPVTATQTGAEPVQTAPAVVDVRDLTVAFDTAEGELPAVSGVSLELRAGGITGLVGESGSGKSTLALALLNAVPDPGRVTGGSVEIAGVGNVLELSTRELRRVRGAKLGYVFQASQNSLNPLKQVGKQLLDLGRSHDVRDLRGLLHRARELLEDMGMDAGRVLASFQHELSGGMRQRVVIAMAMACEPRLLIADEPTTALDVTIQAEILALIDRLKRENRMAVLLVTHDMAVVAQMADRVIVMYRGKVVEEGPVEQIFDNPLAEYTRMLLAATPRLGETRERPRSIRRAPEAESPARTRRGSPLLDVRNLTTRFPVKGGVIRRTIAMVHAVEDVSFSINVGETFSLVGESGSGKSTCGRSILRLVEAQSGKILLDGRDVRNLGPWELRQARRDMQMVFQDPFASLNPHRRLGDQVGEPLVNFKLATKSDVEDRVANLFDRVHLPRDFLNRYPHELSGGQRQRAAIARAIAPNPSLVIADEAVSALDVSVQAQVLDLLSELQIDLGLSLLFISHDMAVVERVSHYVGVMYLGRLVEMGPRAAVFHDPRHPYTRRLLEAVPVPDPRRRRIHEKPSEAQIRSPTYPIGHQVEPSTYDEVDPGHFVLRSY